MYFTNIHSDRLCVYSFLLNNNKLPNTGEGANGKGEEYIIQLNPREDSVELCLFISMECCQHTFSLCIWCCVLSIASKYFSYNVPPISHIHTSCKREEGGKYPIDTGFQPQFFKAAEYH